MKNIVIYSTQTCPYCVRAKNLLASKDLQWTEIDVSSDDELREAMIKKAGGRRTVPQIFIGDTHVGGYDDLAALEKSGKLADLLG